MLVALGPSSPTSVEIPGAKLFRHLADTVRGVYEALFHESDNFRNGIVRCKDTERTARLEWLSRRRQAHALGASPVPGRVFGAEALMGAKPTFPSPYMV